MHSGPTPTPLPFTAERAVELIRLASNPMAKALIALAYYACSADPEVAEAVWK